MRLTNIVLQRIRKELIPQRKVKMAEYSKDYANLPDRYIQRVMRQVYWQTPNYIQYMQKTIEKKRFAFDVERPWEPGFKDLNPPGALNSPVFHVEPIKNWSFFRGDRVEILVGKDKGKQGIVNYIVQERNWVIVEGLNCIYKYVGGDGKSYPGTMIKVEEPLLVTDQVALVDPSDNKATKVEWRFTDEGERVRVSVRTGRIIPIPLKAEETVDYKSKASYKEQAKDTPKDEVEKITFEPNLKTFEMDIMDSMGIVEDNIPQKTYWY